MSAIPGLSLLNFDPPASCSTGQWICIINDIQIPRVKALHCGLDERIPVLSLSLIWHHILPLLFTASLTLEFGCRSAEQCQWIDEFFHQTVGALFLDRMVCNSEQRPFVSRQEITSLFCLKSKCWYNNMGSYINQNEAILLSLHARYTWHRILEPSRAPDIWTAGNFQLPCWWARVWRPLVDSGAHCEGDPSHFNYYYNNLRLV